MATRDEIIGFCDQLLRIEAFEDYGPNGLQVPGSEQISMVVSGVTANRDFLAAAVDAGAELALAHHGLFFGDRPRALSEQMAERLRVTLNAELSLAAYHLPLDAHREIGNNALLCERLGFEQQDAGFADFKGQAIGVIGRSEGIDASELFSQVASLLEREPLVFDDGPRSVRTIGIVSGGGSKAIEEAAALGLDAFLTGEPSEHAMGDAREAGIHFIAGGHYATETLGVRRLGELVAEHFRVKHEFIDVPNPI